jgi:hypothetical protein
LNGENKKTKNISIEHEAGKKAIRIAFDKRPHLLRINTIGIRIAEFF